jgi:SMODS and SLOG-associating 2TM effector domain family 4
MANTNEYDALEAQIRECFGRVIYTHKTHSKMADRAASRLKALKISQIVLSSLTASGTISVIFTDRFTLKLLTALLSLGTVGLTAYMKGFDPGAVAQRHRDTAADIWPIRESYLSLLTDIVGGEESLTSIRERRDALQASLAAIYKGAPHTDGKAYGDAQIALQKNEEYTFSDAEIDRFLPQSLRRGGRQIREGGNPTG